MQQVGHDFDDSPDASSAAIRRSTDGRSSTSIAAALPDRLASSIPAGFPDRTSSWRPCPPSARLRHAERAPAATTKDPATRQLPGGSPAAKCCRFGNRRDSGPANRSTLRSAEKTSCPLVQKGLQSFIARRDPSESVHLDEYASKHSKVVMLFRLALSKRTWLLEGESDPKLNAPRIGGRGES